MNRAGVRVTKEGIVISAALDVGETELLDAARMAHRKARRVMEPNRTRRADERSFRAKAARAQGATWREVADQLAELTGRENLTEREVQRWAERWDRMTARLNGLSPAEVEDDTPG